MKSFLLTGLFVAITLFSCAQPDSKFINAKEAERIIRVLASDEMKGRKLYSPEIDKAADFIASEFKAAGLQYWDKNTSYLQPFTLVNTKQTSASLSLEGTETDNKKLLVITSQPELAVSNTSGYATAYIKAGASFFEEAISLVGAKENTIVWVDESFEKNFARLSVFKRNLFRSDNSVIFILSGKPAAAFSIKATHTVEEKKLANVVGILPGKSKKNEYVIFSGHYDHIGIGKPVNGDSIYNGANDDAAGTTAVILLAKHYAALKNNERTLVFAAFTAEEVGGFGSRYFSRQFDPAKVMAMFNIEMIGTESKWGRNSAYITGYDKSSMGQILEANLKGSGFTFYPDPYTTENLFYRSDNATLAELGVPAHTISTAKMENEPNYHKVSDQVETLDMANMTMIIKAISISAASIIQGKDTPTRVQKEGAH